MTLTLMLVAPWGVWQCSDFRLTRSGRYVDDWSIKHVSVRCLDAAALITYTGAGWVKGFDTSIWLAKQLEGEALSLKETLQLIRTEASSQRVRGGSKFHAFIIGAFTEEKPVAYSIENHAPSHDFEILEHPTNEPLVKGEQVAFLLPSLNFGAQRLDAVQPCFAQALLDQYGDLDLNHVEPRAVHRRVDEL